MNTSKLHIITNSLKKELRQSGIVGHLNTIVSNLEQLNRQPNNAQHQQQLSTSLTQLYAKLENSAVESFSPAWRDAMEEIGVEEEFGHTVMNKIKDIMERNTITYQVAFNELQKIQTRISDTEKKLNELLNSLNYFNVGEDILVDNECEVGIIVPRSFVENNLKKFGEELVELEKTLAVFSELGTGSREPLKIRTISSSELSVFLDSIPAVAAAITVAIERVVALYNQILDIKLKKEELKKLNVPEESLKGLDTHAQSVVEPELEKITDELLEMFGEHIDKNRKNEIKTELQNSINKIANKVDRGFNFEIRVSHIEDKSIDNEDEEVSQTQEEQYRAEIVEMAKKIDYSKKTGASVLFLPENTDE